MAALIVFSEHCDASGLKLVIQEVKELDKKIKAESAPCTLHLAGLVRPTLYIHHFSNQEGSSTALTEKRTPTAGKLPKTQQTPMPQYQIPTLQGTIPEQFKIDIKELPLMIPQMTSSCPNSLD